MPRIAAVATASPSHKIPQAQAKQFARTIFSEHPKIDQLLPVFDNAAVRERQFVMALDWFDQKRDFTETNQHYIESALNLSESAVGKLCEQTQTDPREFDIIFFVSTTGLSTPSLDARLANRIAFNPHIKRVPIWGLGCAAGAGAIARAHDYLLAYPSQRALIVSVELCGLSFQPTQYSKSNLIAAALFGDGAAACLMVGDQVELPHPAHHAQPTHPAQHNNDSQTPKLPRTLASHSTLYHDTLDVMGWHITSDGFRVQLSRDIPTIVASVVRDNVIDFLKKQGRQLDEIERYILHPGGAKVLKAYADSLNLEAQKLETSSAVLQDHGNMSSATIFFILERALAQHRESAPAYGLISALGPGFSSEMVLVLWE